MICEKCGYIEDNYNNIYACYCDKLDSNILQFGPCEEDNVMSKSYERSPRKLNKYERKQKYKRKLKRLAEECDGYIGGAYYVLTREKWDAWDPKVTSYYVYAKENYKYIRRYYRSNHTPGSAGFLKRIASRKFRRYKGIIPNGGGYKKTFDYWWELY